MYSENIFAIDKFNAIDGEGVTKSWYDEIRCFNWTHPSGTSADKKKCAFVAHFTVVVWKLIRQIGCGYATKEQP